MVKGRVAPPKCLFYVANQALKRSLYSNRTVSTLSLVKNWDLLTIHSYMHN